MILRDLVLSGRLPRLQDLAYCHRRHRVSARRADSSLAGGQLRRLAGRRSSTASSGASSRFEDAVRGPTAGVSRSSTRSSRSRCGGPTTRSAEDHASLSSEAQLICAAAAIKPTYAANDTTDGDVLYASGAQRLHHDHAARAVDGGHARAIITAGRSVAFENLHEFDSRIDASRARAAAAEHPLPRTGMRW